MARLRGSLVAIARGVLDAIVEFTRLVWEFLGVDGLAELILLLLLGGW